MPAVNPKALDTGSDAPDFFATSSVNSVDAPLKAPRPVSKSLAPLIASPVAITAGANGAVIGKPIINPPTPIVNSGEIAPRIPP